MQLSVHLSRPFSVLFLLINSILGFVCQRWARRVTAVEVREALSRLRDGIAVDHLLLGEEKAAFQRAKEICEGSRVMRENV